MGSDKLRGHKSAPTMYRKTSQRLLHQVTHVATGVKKTLRREAKLFGKPLEKLYQSTGDVPEQIKVRCGEFFP